MVSDIGVSYVIPGHRAAMNPESRDSRFALRAPRNDDEQSIHPEKIALADFHAVVPENAVGGGGVEVEIREREIVEELLALHGQGIGRADGKGDVACIGVLELRRLERLAI